MGKKIAKNNEGFSLVEMIIVIAIIAIMAGAAMVTVTIMRSAKAKEAATTFDIELAEMQAKTKGQVCVVNGTEERDYKFAMCLYKDGGKFFLQKCYYKGSGSMDQAANYVSVASENASSGKGTSLSPYVEVKFTPKGGTERAIAEGDNAVYIVFNRQGECVNGYGVYSFYKNNGNLICDVQLNRIGSRQSTY